MTDSVVVGSADVSLSIFIEDSRSGDGAGLPDLTFDATGLAAYYRRSNMSEPLQITLVTASAATHTDGGFVRTDLISAAPVANLAGSYVLHGPDAMWASGQFVELTINGAANMVPYRKVIRIAANPQVAVDAALDAAGSEPTGPLSPTASIRQRIAHTSHYTQNEMVDDTSTGKTQVKNNAGTVIIEHTNVRTGTSTTRGKGTAP